MPEIIADVVFTTEAVATVKFALVDPAGTVTFGGTLATDWLSLARLTIAPPVGAAPVRFAVPCAGLPPLTAVGLMLTDDRVTAAGITVKEVLALAPQFPEIVSGVEDAT